MSSGRSNFAQRAIAVVSKAGALSLLGFVLAYWTWAWWAPSPLPAAMQTFEPSASLAAAGNLFGQPPGGARADVPTGLAVKLLGVMAAMPEGSGYALLQLDAKETQLVRAGGYLAPGIRLEKVLPQQVILQRNGSRETLVWPRPVQAPATTTSTSVR
ncbi:general secretion pathway protein [Rhodanobacter sp. Soil772]|uniref:type II secretion system protein N n=1 Tax=Rhodanobacter sp. Soil772 TaxID=1736406 RepID=UPI0006F7B7E8|nr:type II secretion system protein N [Rhodanobacter sp. Soil772]KRE86937.1 general secretion pathway protein [Rhodanobacter sp. Soil772]